MASRASSPFNENKCSRSCSCVCLLMSVAALGIGLGVIIGYFSHSSAFDGPCLGNHVPSKITEDATASITERIIALMSASSISEFHRQFTLYPHLAGTPGEDVLAAELYNTWIQQGLDYVTNDTYEVLLSYPNRSDPNYVYLFDDDGNEVYRSQKFEKILSADQNHSDVVPPFNAYSPSGHVRGRLVYVNYGRIEDYDRLANDLSVDVNGSIAIARYGRIFRGDKVQLAASHGIIGMILYSDPADYSIDPDVPTFPDSWWMPGTGVQLGSVLSTIDGDPLTPNYPSIASAYRLTESDAYLPVIPVHPIGYDDAYQFLSIMGGPDAPNDWQGALNFTYRLGPGFKQSNANWAVELHVSTYNERRNTTNVFAYITGSVEPDRYVLLGNHRDAWMFGAVDPTSGTSVMMEVSRVLAKLVTDEGWRPRRTIVFCSWGAEEYGLIGSTEWVEHYVKNLGDRAVAYFNVDMSVEGNISLRARALPILYDFVYDVAKRVQSANNPQKTLYEEWLETFPDPTNSIRPLILSLGSGSDYASFVTIAGIPSIDIRYTHNDPISSFPLYHSVYETRYLVTQHMDPQFAYSLSIGQYWAEAARYMSDSLLLPLSVTNYATALRGLIQRLDDGYGELMTQNGLSLDDLYAACDEFNRTAIQFAARAYTVNRRNPIETRMYNDQLMRLERAFLDSEGLPPSRPQYKHVLFAPSVFDSYSGASFPGLVDLMWRIEDDRGDDRVERWQQVRRHLATVIYTIHSAISVIRDTHRFK